MISFVAAGTGVGPTGTVILQSSSGSVCYGDLVTENGCSIKFSTSGSKVLTAHYQGDNNFKASISPSVVHTVK